MILLGLALVATIVAASVTEMNPKRAEKLGEGLGTLLAIPLFVIWFIHLKPIVEERRRLRQEGDSEDRDDEKLRKRR